MSHLLVFWAYSQKSVRRDGRELQEFGLAMTARALIFGALRFSIDLSGAVALADEAGSRTFGCFDLSFVTDCRD